ncbi:hypothetical protein ES332_D11G377200v1 [Gossypium tomentosum]|uniref:Uncharacterized protein n=1 Tax=Gossypium tomentosum TaxID=34277 RepID=A0A5D2IY07_GOSTO|nr:hypothetical protein ES332_D11G377200v1 [Gossypium tomentosum]
MKERCFSSASVNSLGVSTSFDPARNSPALITELKSSGNEATPSKYDITLDMLGLAPATGYEQSNPSFNTNSACCFTNLFSKLLSIVAKMSPLSQQSVIQSARNASSGGARGSISFLPHATSSMNAPNAYIYISVLVLAFSVLASPRAM